MSRLDWFKEAKYGLFIHFGIYALPGGEWHGEPSPHGSEWIMKNMKIPYSEYKELAKKFDPKSFDPYYYVRNAKKWGMKYLTFTAKHHDGFAMYDTKVSDYNVMNTPYGKDIVKQLADACEAEGLTFCIYYSQMQDWEHPDGYGNNWDFDPEKKDFNRYFYEKCIPQVKELLTNYGKVGMMWFDTPYDMPEELCRELAEVVRACQPDCLINSRIGYGYGDFREVADNTIPVLSRCDVWESPMTMNSSWGYIKRDKTSKSSSDVLQNLVRIVGKGGNLLLNLGPDENGLSPKVCTDALDSAGKWLEKYGDSIFGTTNIPNFPYLLPWGDLTYSAIRKTLYFHVKNYPAFPHRVLLTGLQTKVRSVTLMYDGSQLKYSQSYEPGRDEHRLYVFLPEVCPDSDDTVVAVELEGEATAQTI